MARIAFLLLCHKDPEAIIRQATQLTAAGDFIAVHFDASAPRGDYEKIRAGLAGNPYVTFADRRIRCGWGEWSLVAATMLAARAALDAFPEASHLYLLSGDCMAIKSARYAHRLLDGGDRDYIESVDFFESGWIRTGIREERLIYRHVFNERRHKRAFYWSMWAQRRLGLKRAIPADLQMQIGSQWWCLRRATVQAVLDFAESRPDVLRFFRTTWIPDETFFQTLVRHLIPDAEIVSRSPTFLMFSDYGMPVTFYNDHYDLLLAQEHLFARKISPEAARLNERLGELYASGREDFVISNEGRRLFDFLTSRGRAGRRFAPRFWEAEASLGPGHELLIVTSKKWHVAKRLIAAIREETGLPAIDYLFNEEETALPDLGGIQTTLEKRTRHRRALMRMLFDHFASDRLVICLDTANLDLMQDFHAEGSLTRILEVDCSLNDSYLAGHARRLGLAGAGTPDHALDALLPTLRRDMEHESDRLRAARFAHYHRISEGSSVEANAAALAAFLSLGEDAARTLAETPHLFMD